MVKLWVSLQFMLPIVTFTEEIYGVLYLKYNLNITCLGAILEISILFLALMNIEVIF
jgi:hypothetical protein